MRFNVLNVLNDREKYGQIVNLFVTLLEYNKDNPLVSFTLSEIREKHLKSRK